MHCPHLKSFDTEMCVSNDYAIIPSQQHRDNFCKADSHWACPIKSKFVELADAFSYSII
jgi:hypothetical protein